MSALNKKDPEIATHSRSMSKRKHIALIAHDHRKKDMLDWVQYNAGSLRKHKLFGTGTTGSWIERETGLNVHRYMSGPLGGDQQIGAAIAEQRIDMLIFFWDPLSAQPHDVDVKALLRIAVVYNIPMACNRASADFMISSPLMETAYEQYLIDYGSRLKAESAHR